MDALLTVTGNVGSDIEVRTDDSNDWAYAAFRLATTPRFNRNGTWRDGETTWLNVNCRNRALSLNLKASVHKGDPVIVTGRLTTWNWTNPETGEIQGRLVFDAIAAGHDLSRGTASFQRAERSHSEPPPVEDAGVFNDLERSVITGAQPERGEAEPAEPEGVDAKARAA